MMRFPLAWRPARRISMGLMTVAVVACAASTPAPTSSRSPSGERDTTIRHDPCDKDSSAAQKVDVNGDSRPDIVHVMQGGREVCRVVDLNLDGAVDAFIYYDDKGIERRRESDFDRDGRADEIAHYQGGAVTLKERETNFDDKIDTWDHYEGSRLVRRERDSDGDMIVDQWWQFNNPTNAKCAVVATDQNADGKPDPNSVVDLCGESYGAPKPGAAPTAGAPTSAVSAAPPSSPAPAATPGSGSSKKGP
jgi:hypothetical protein